jgi:serine/threonine-protein phosphatase 2B catalytic subunit
MPNNAQINYPKSFVLLRGNHESRNMTEHFTFRQEVIEKFDEDLYELIIDSFDCMPLSAIVDDKYLLTHGGISPDLIKVIAVLNIIA